jgi:hypothetical protein
MRAALTFASLLLLAPLSGCDLLGIETATVAAAKREAEGKAIGGACRHAGRAIEDCYTLNRKADKGAVFAGWREMNDYMRENKIEEIAPTLPPPGAPAPAAAAASAPAADDEDAEPASKRAKAKGH